MLLNLSAAPWQREILLRQLRAVAMGASPRLPLENEGYEIVALRSKFKENTPDESWMASLGQEGGWNVISGDFRIITNRQRRIVWTASKLTTFFLHSSWMNDAYTETFKTARFLSRWDEIAAMAEKAEPGTPVPLTLQGKDQARRLLGA
jgi:hypothetical protein